MDLYCHGGGFKGSVDRASAKRSLERSLGRRNVAHEVLKKAKSPEEVGTTFMEDFGFSWLMARAAAIICAAVTLVMCLLFCLASLCRCCAYERPTRRSLKNYAALVILVVLIGLLLCTIASLQGYAKLHEGFSNAECTSVRLLDTLLRGENPQVGSFRGLLPVLEEFERAENTFEQGSGFMRGMENVLHISDDVNKSATLVSETLLLLKDVMKENRIVKSAAGKDLFHECRFCKVVEGAADSATASFSSSPASKLAGARRSLAHNLSLAEKERIKRDLRESAKKLVEVKTSVVDSIGQMMEDGGSVKKMKDNEQFIDTVMLALVLLVTLAAFLLSLCAGVSVYRFTFHEMDQALEDQGLNPYNAHIHAYAHTTWCCGFCYAATALLVAGLVFVAAAPPTSFCLLLDDLDGGAVRDIAPALGMNLSLPSYASAPEIVERCFKPPPGAMDTYLLDLLFTTKDGRRVSAREQVRSAAGEGLRSRFADITAASDQPAPPLLQTAEAQALLRLAAFDRIDAMITGVPGALRAEDRYADMAIPRAGLGAFLGASIACADLALPADMGAAPGETAVPGIRSLAEKLKTMGTEEAGPGSGCAARVSCAGGGFAEAACKAANRYIDLKAEVRSSGAFRCDMFQAPGDPAGFCDPLHMQSQAGLDGVMWSADCLGTDGTVKRKQRTCTLPEFVDYVKGFEQRLRRVYKRLDEQMQLEQPGIGSIMRNLMQRHILQRSDFLANGVTCKFFASYYQELIDGACYQGICGLRSIAKTYVWCAVLSAFLIATMYAVWCRSKGNIENWKADRTEYKALLEKEREAEEARKRAAEGKDEEDTVWVLGDPNDPRRRMQAPGAGGPPRREEEGTPRDEGER